MTAGQGARSPGSEEVDALRVAYTDLTALVGSLDEDTSWVATACAGWTVRDMVQHLLADAQRALVALARTILELCWHLLTTDQPYRDRGADYYDKRRHGAAIKTALQRLRDAGCQVTTNKEGILITTA